MPNLTNIAVTAAGAPVVGALVTVELIGAWSADGLREVLPAAVWSGVADVNGAWTADLPAQSTYEGSTYYLVREHITNSPGTVHYCTIADAPATQTLRDRLTTPVAVATSLGLSLDGLTDVTTSGALAGKVLGFDGTIWKPVTPSGGGGGGGSVNSVSAGDATITIGGTTADPTVVVGAVPESKITNLVTDLAAKASSAHAHAESDVTSLVADLAVKAADAAVVHNSGAETVAGVKTFSSAPVVPAPGTAGNPVRNDDTRLADSRAPTVHAHLESDVVSLVGDLAAKQPLDSDLTTIAGLTATTDTLIQSVAGAWASRTLVQVKTTLALVKGDVGLGNADNTSDVGKPVSTATSAALATKADLLVVVTSVSANYTLVLTDNNKAIESTSASAITVTIPPNSSVAFAVGAVVEIAQIGAGQVTIAAGAGVTLRTSSSLTTRAQYSALSIRQRATDDWILSGDMT